MLLQIAFFKLSYVDYIPYCSHFNFQKQSKAKFTDLRNFFKIFARLFILFYFSVRKVSYIGER